MYLQHSVTTSDGLTLAAYEASPTTADLSADPSAPTIVLVHGYPDDHQVWDGLVAELSDTFRVLTYDVRGSGSSDAPSSRAGYRIPTLVADLGAVLDALAPGERVHLVGHDWGSIQCWAALAPDALGPRLLSYTSISGPSLDMASRWLRDRRHVSGSVRQLAASFYIGLFQLPVLPELAVRRGVLSRATRRSVAERDGVNGLELYRANFLGRIARPRTTPIEVPVQVLAPRADPYVARALQTEAPRPYVQRLRTRVIEGGHWVVAQDPALIAGHVRSFVGAL